MNRYNYSGHFTPEKDFKGENLSNCELLNKNEQMKEEFNDSLEQVLKVIEDSAANEIAENNQ